jgi:hypothetical protein
MDDATQEADQEESITEAGLARRVRRAQEEEMDISLRRTGGVYDVQSASGNTYRVDIGGGECSCPDWQKREPPGGCKHLRRVRLEIHAGHVPTPDGRLPDSGADSTPTEPRAAADGGRRGGVTGPHIEFDKQGDPTGETYFRCEDCGREAIHRSDLEHR